MQILFDVARTTLALLFLFYASWSDYKTREVSNKVWMLLAPSAFTLTIIEILLYEEWQLLPYGICFTLTAAIAIILFYSGGFGGADAKALMCLALALPFYPKNLLNPLLGQISPIGQTFFPIVLFSNSVLFGALTAIAMILYNYYWRVRNHRKLFEGHQNQSLGKKFLVLLTGYKVSVSKLKEKWHLYPLEDIESFEGNVKRKLVIMPRDEGRNAIVERLEKANENGIIQDMVWATPGLPMLIFITAGLIIALLFGDIVWIFVNLLLR